MVILHANAKKRIYVSGPYSFGDPVLNARAAIEVGDQLREAGFVPFIPHLTMLWHFVSPHEWQWWIDYDEDWLYVCDGLVRMQGQSKGADIEVEKAKQLGLPVFGSVESCIDFFRVED